MKLSFHALVVVGVLHRGARYVALGLALGALAGCSSSDAGRNGAAGASSAGSGNSSAGTLGSGAGSSGAGNGGSENGGTGAGGSGTAGDAGAGDGEAGRDGSSAGNGGSSSAGTDGSGAGSGGVGTGGNSGSAGGSSTPPTYVIGGTITGLPPGQSVVLQDNGANDLSVTQNGSFEFSTQLVVGASFEVTVRTQPTGATCSVSNGAGTSSPDAVAAVAVTCSSITRSVGGTITGLAGGKTLILQNNGSDDLTRAANGGFSFATSVANGSAYAVTVATQPVGQTCTVASGTGTATANITTIAITCVTNNFTVGGTLTGLGSGKTLTLRNNGGNGLTLTQNGSFTFTAPIPSDTDYTVTVFTQASGQTCSVSNGNGTVIAANVTTVNVTCSSNSYSVGGAVTGLPTGKSLVLQNNGGNDLTLFNNGTFTFTAPVADSAGYTVTVSSQTPPVTCSVSNGTGTINGANVTNVAVNCSLSAYLIGGTVTGLAPGKALVLRNNGGDDLTITTNGSYTFATPVTSGSSYAVVAQTLPVGQSCNVASASGTVNAANVTNVNVQCFNLPYTVGGTISGLGAGKQLLLNLNGGNNYLFNANGSFTVPGTLVDGQSYAVSVTSSPVGQLCKATNASGTIQAANVTNVSVICAPAYFLSFATQTVAAGQSFVLQNNGADNKTVTGPIDNGSDSFATAVLDGTGYNVTILTQPVGQTCVVQNGTGTINGGNTSGPLIVCTQLTIKIQAPNLASATKVRAFVFSGTTLVAGRENISLDATGNGTFLMSRANATVSALNLFPAGFPAALLNGTYAVLVSIDKTGNGLLAANADDWNYFALVTLTGPTTLTLGNADFKPYLNFGLTFSGQTAVANMNYFCAPHLPNADIFADFAQRTLFGVATGKTDASGNGTLVSGVVAQGTFDFTCLADNPNATSGTTELQPYSLTTGKGMDSGFDYLATKNNVSVQAAGTAAVSGFTLASASTGVVACSGVFSSGGTGTPGTGSFNGNNNSATLSGVSGCVAGTASGVHKNITVDAPTGTGASHYTYGTPVLENRGATSFSMIIPITNSSGSAHGGVGVAFNGVTFKDASSNVIGTSFSAKVAGSTCVSGSSTISTCLAAGETGYLLVGGNGYATVTSATFVINDNSAATGMNAKVIPQTFTRYSDGELRIRVTNQGLGNGDLSTLSTTNNSFVVAFDQDGNPSDFGSLIYGLTDHVFANNHIAGTTAPKNSLVLVQPASSYPLDSASPQIKVFLSFGDTATAPN